MGSETASRGVRTEGRHPPPSRKTLTALILGNNCNVFFIFPCLELAHAQAALPAGWLLLGLAAPFPPGLHPVLGCRNGEMGTLGLPRSIHSSQKFPVRELKAGRKVNSLDCT